VRAKDAETLAVGGYGLRFVRSGPIAVDLGGTLGDSGEGGGDLPVADAKECFGC
jgi:hypothetical protein